MLPCIPFTLILYIYYYYVLFPHFPYLHIICLQSEGAYDQIEKEARRVAQGLGAEYWAVSSKTGDNVESLFLRVAALTFDRSVVQELSGGGSDRRKQSTVSEYISLLLKEGKCLGYLSSAFSLKIHH